MNLFMALASLLMAGACGTELYRGNPKMAGVYACYAVANFLLGRM